MRTLKIPALIFAAILLISSSAHSAEGAKGSGNWNDGSIWTSGSVPTSSEEVFIGAGIGTTPPPLGTIGTATITLTQNQSAGDVRMGLGDTASGTLNLGGHRLAVNGTLYVGLGGKATINEEGGSIIANSWVFNDIDYTFGLNDRSRRVVTLQNGSEVTTSSETLFQPLGVPGQGQINVTTGSILNLGNNLRLPTPPASSSLVLQDAGSTLHMNGHNIEANSIYFGGTTNEPVIIDRGSIPGSLKTQALYLRGNNFDLIPSDKVGTLALTNANTTLNDQVTISSLGLDNASATITSSQNVTNSARIYSGSKLEVNADLVLYGSLDIRDTGSTVHMNGHNITAGSITVGGSSIANGDSTQISTLDRGETPGALEADRLLIYNVPFELLLIDQVNSLTLINSSTTLKEEAKLSSLILSKSDAVINSTQNLSGDLYVYNSTLTLNADLELTGNINIGSVDTTIEANNFNISADKLTAIYGDGISLNDVGLLRLNELILQDSSLAIHGTIVEKLLRFYGNSVLTIFETNEIGLTLNGEIEGLDENRQVMQLNITGPGWAFRWQNKSPDSNHVSELETLIASAKIGLVVTPGIDYLVYDQGGYTYIGTTPVPEASSLLLAGVVCGSCFAARVIKKRR